MNDFLRVRDLRSGYDGSAVLHDVNIDLGRGEVLALLGRNGVGKSTLVGAMEPLAKVDGVLNAIQIEGDLVGRVQFQGRGAGPAPTASAVLADVLDVARGIVYRDLEVLNIRLGAGHDSFDVVSTHAGSTSIWSGAGNDEIRIYSIDGHTIVVQGVGTVRLIGVDTP